MWTKSDQVQIAENLNLRQRELKIKPMKEISLFTSPYFTERVWVKTELIRPADPNDRAERPNEASGAQSLLVMLRFWFVL